MIQNIFLLYIEYVKKADQNENSKKLLKTLIIPYTDRKKRLTQINRQHNQGIGI